MTPEQQPTTEKKAISKRAQATLDRIRQGDFYEIYGNRARRSLDELELAGLIVGAARSITIGAYYVPATGYVPMTNEAFEGQENYPSARIGAAAHDLFVAAEKYERLGWLKDHSCMDAEGREAAKAMRAALAKARGGAK